MPSFNALLHSPIRSVVIYEFRLPAILLVSSTYDTFVNLSSTVIFWLVFRKCLFVSS